MADSTLIQDRYRLDDLIGRGGMGEVWRAEDELLGRPVAVKCLKPMGRRSSEAALRGLRERFRREARVAAGLQHRGVTVVHDFGEADGMLYLVMEMLDGRNLRQLLAANKRQPLPVAEVLRIGQEVAAALAYTHERSVVHRDLKPANVMVTVDGSVKICDFGIARLGHDIGFTAKITGAHVAMGTPHYMSPEQIAGAPVDHRSDLYSLGCVLYELATGAPPFDHEDAWAVFVGHRDEEPEPPRSRRPELPRELEKVILALLAKEPEARPSDAGDAGLRLAALRGPVPPAAAAATEQAAPAGEFAEQHRAALRLGRQGLREQAAEAHRALVAAREQELGPGHPATLVGRYELGFALGRLGRYEEALAEYGRVVAGAEPDTPETLAARQESAYVLGRLGRHTEAYRYYAEVADALTRLRGARHPDTLGCRHNLALCLGRLGRLEESLRMAEEVAGARAEVLGADARATLLTRCEVAYALGRLGRWEEASETCREVARGRARTLGEDHPDTLAVRYETGVCLGRLGRAAEAVELYRGLVAARTRTEGATGAETLRARHGLGVNLGRLGRWEEALAESREVHRLRGNALGPSHGDTLVSAREVAVGLGWLGRWHEALQVYRSVSEACARALGPGHPAALAARDDEAQCRARLGRPEEAAVPKNAPQS